jgi:hypothetical protein
LRLESYVDANCISFRRLGRCAAVVKGETRDDQKLSEEPGTFDKVAVIQDEKERINLVFDNLLGEHVGCEMRDARCESNNGYG